MTPRNPAQRERLGLLLCLVVAALVHGWLATRNWTAGFMPGHEFRQSQTAFISHFIDRENDFSLLYEAPIVGKPWVSILLEVPVYEWSVVLLSRATGWSHVVAARSISLACFYLTLPALWLLLGWIGVERMRRVLPLVLILTCPVYIFYSRAFLMESMELMACAWFLVGFVGMMERRRWPWFVLTTIAGTAAALIKSATFAVWLLPAAAYGAWQLGRDLRARAGWGPIVVTVFWGLAGAIVPLGALRLWIELTDPIKANHASAWIFTSANLSLGNWGLNDLSARFSAATWGTLLQRWQEALMAPALIGVALLAGLVAFPAQRVRVAGLAAVFFLAQLLFPFAYAYQEYYFYACAVFLLAALGAVLGGVLDSRLPRWAAWLVVAVLPLAQLHNYGRVYYPQQIIPSPGGHPFTLALRDLTPRESVIVVSGADWAAIIPLYAERRALMIRNGLENDRAYLQRAFADLADEEVSALVLLREYRYKPLVRELAVAAFGLESTPTFSYADVDIYCSRRLGQRVRQGLKERGNYSALIVPSTEAAAPVETGVFRLNAGVARTELRAVTPTPFQGRFDYGLGTFPYEGRTVINAHPHSELWLRAPGASSRIEWDYGMVAAAWERAGDKSDGIDLVITGLRPGQGERELYRRRLDPVARPADRGLQREVIPYAPLPGELLHFSTGPGGSLSYDWAYWARIEVK
ncbi:hypothetical protein Verru16b_02034 [Lacunisphaera limnophila]|uniref:Glycosyltransferase RgtA/B/C/D-like domain-containing protein n=1 Tax=Lacunisphaera limnophila TaxID=1838286 RepID=A0A1D8AVU1_9BACT|nr:hypothetical protein [Lacunisphaera limnophila]AOS44965.1 hypothetical protein Verru16b_02034 [Lacunisphaera limnophila]